MCIAIPKDIWEKHRLHLGRGTVQDYDRAEAEALERRRTEILQHQADYDLALSA